MKAFRKLLSLCLTAALAAGLVVNAAAASPVTVVVNGGTADVAAHINDDWRTMVPVDIADQMGLTYSVSGNSVTFTGDGTSETYTVGVPAGGTAPEMVDGTIYVPFAHLAQTFGYTVGWDGAAGQASAQKGTPVDMDAYLLANTEKTNDTTRALPIDRTEVNEHPVVGYYTYTLDSGRTVKLYVPEHAALRNYITVIALPNGVEDTYAFLEGEGWIEQANLYGELLFVLEPADGVWGTPAEEAAYLEACIGEALANDADGTRETKSGGIVQTGKFALSDGTSCPVFTGHSCNYYVGYGEGCAVLESWTANNTIYVIAQAFIGGESAGQDILTQAGDRVYNGYNSSSYYPGYPDDQYQATLDKLAEEGVIQSSAFITNKDVPVPTLFSGRTADDASVTFWITASDAVATDEAGVYRQSLDSDAWQTAYANQLAQEWGSQYGISQVVLADDAPDAAEIRDFLSGYTRYTNQFAYSNNLAVRQDYYQTTKAAREAAEGGAILSTYAFQGYEGTQETAELRALESTRLTAPISGDQGTFYSMVYAFNDYDGNGVNDPREAIVYVPDSALTFGGDGAPVVVIFPGNTQAAATFMDCSGWWQIANEQGCVIMIMGEYCVSSAASLTYGSDEDKSEMSRAALAILEETVSQEAGVQLDMTRVYGSGHSAGSRTVQTLTHTSDADYFAAVASTSFPNTDFTAEGRMPSYLFAGQADISEEARDLVKDPWDTSEGSAIYNWVTGAQQMNGIEAPFAANDHDSFLAACSEYTETGRYYTYTWDNADGVPMVQFTRTMAREHNCYPEEFQLAWDYLAHFRLTEDGTRYYSASAFTQDDAIQIG